MQFLPASKWVLDYADDSCAARREFNAGDETALLELRQFGPGESFQVRVVTTLRRTNEFPRVRFDPDTELVEERQALFSDNKHLHGLLYYDSFRPDRPSKQSGSPPAWADVDRDARERAITGLTVAESFEQDFTLQTGSAHQVMEGMRTCLDELLTHWGIDAAVQRTLSRRPVPIDQVNWARRIQQTYPIDKLRARRSGVAIIRLIVGADGKPTSCIPNKDSPDQAFDEHACRTVMRYAKFEPALDATGAPTASFWTTSITYQTF